MPIRSPRGRAAAYRGIWQWPLRSPGRLLTTLVIVAVVVAGVSIGIGAVAPERAPGASADRATPTGAAAPSGRRPSTPVPTVLPAVPALTPSTVPLTAASPAAVDVASRWTRAWLRPPPGTTAQQWLDGLAPLTTPEFLGLLTTVDPTNIPATRLTGPATAVSAAPRSVRVQVPTDATTLVVVVIDDNGWRVADSQES